MNESAKQCQTSRLALFGMKLRGMDGTRAHSRRERDSVVASGADDAGICWFRVIGMDEVKPGILRKVVEKGSPCLREGVPPHMGNFEVSPGEFDNAPREKAEPLGARRFLARRKEELVSETDAQVGLAGAQPIEEGGAQSGGIKAGRAIPKGTHAGNNNRVRAGESVGRHDPLHARAAGLESLGDAAQIPAPIIHQRENGRPRVVSGRAGNFRSFWRWGG